MKFRIRFAEQVVGAFVLLAIAFLAAILILMGANQRWFEKNYYFSSRFVSGKGLNVGMPITLKGFKIGQVSSINLNEENEVDIEFYVYESYYEKILENSVLALISNPLGLGGGLVLHPGKPPAPPVPENSFIPSLDLKMGKDLVEAGLVQLPEEEDVITQLIGDIRPILNNANTTLLSVNQLLATTNSTLLGDNQGPIGDIFVQVDTITKETNALLKEIQQIAANVEETTAALRDPTGVVQTVLDPKGSIATILNDDNVLFDQIQSILNELNATVEEFKKLSQFANESTPQISGLLEKGREALDEGKDVLEGLKNNPLLRGGITQKKEQQTTFQSYRDEDF